MSLTTSGNITADGVVIAGVPLTATATQLNALSSAELLYSRTVTATMAEVNSAKVILPAVSGVSYKVFGYIMRVAGAFDTSAGAGVSLQDTTGTPVVVATVAKAALTDGAVLLASAANTTLAAGFAASLTAGKGVNIVKSTATAHDAGSSITVTVIYSCG